MKEHFLQLANVFLNERDIGPQSLAELLEQVYESGVLDERYGDWNKEKEQTMESPLQVEVVIEPTDTSHTERTYQAGINEFTKGTIRR